MNGWSSCLCLLLLSLFVVGDSCLDGVATPVSPDTSATQPVGIPKLHNISVSAPAADWQGQGLPLTVFTGDSAQVKPNAQFGVTARIGWNDDGLLAQIRVIDSTPSEAETLNNLYDGDSVELLLNAAQPDMGMLQLIISPGRDPAHPQVRQTFFDYRSKPLKQRSHPTGQGFCQRTRDGYITTLFLPWENLDIQPRDGLTVGARISVNDAAPGQDRTRLTWVSSGKTYDFWDLPAVRLATAATAAPQYTAWAAYNDLTTVHVNILGDRTFAGKPVQVLERGQLRATGTLHLDGDRALATLSFAAPPIGKTNDRLQVKLDGQTLITLTLPDLETARRDLFQLGEFSSTGAATSWAVPRFSSPVFTGDTFPRFGYAAPDRIQRAIGNITIKQRFYDAQGQLVTRAEKPGRYGAVTTLTRQPWDSITRYDTLFRLPVGGAIQPSDHPVALAAAWETSQDSRAIDPEKRDRDWWHQLRKQLGTAIQYEYFVRLPQGYQADPTRRWPIIYYLHGSGGGDQNAWSTVKENEGPQYFARTNADFPFIVVALRSPGGWYPPAVKDVMDDIEQRYRVDTQRQYLTGFSMGGIGTWHVAYDQPHRFAAIAPVGGLRGDPSKASLLKHLAVWVFNGAEDSATPAAEARLAVRALQAIGANVKYTEIPNADHGDSLSIAYSTPELYTWFLQQRQVVAKATRINRVAPQRAP